MRDSIIFHIDVNSAFLSWTAVHQKIKNPEAVDLRAIPAIIGGDREKRRGIVLAKSLPAKEYQIQTGEPVQRALEKCPSLTIAKPDYTLYEQSSKALMALLCDYTDQIEQYSIDEAFMDMTQCCHLFGTPVEAAEEIRERVFEELGFTVNIGVSSNKLLAKMASDFKKPNRVHTLFKEEIPDKMWPLPVRDLFYVGPATEKKLHTLEIYRVGDLARCDKGLLKSHLKKHGEVIWNYANGLGADFVEPVPEPNKGYGNSTTTPRDVTDLATARLFLLSLTETVCTRMRHDDVEARLVCVSIRDFEFRHKSHQRVLPFSTNITNQMAAVAYELLEEMWDQTPLRHLGVHASKLVNHSARQMSLFDEAWNHEKALQAEEAIDSIRSRFGNDAVKRCCFLQSPVRSLAGGIPAEYK